MRSDAELLAAAGAEPAAFRELYNRYAARIHGYHLRRCGDDHAALDLTAETFAQSWLSRTRFDDRHGGSVSPWLFGIARHVLLVSVRHRRLERAACERLGVLERLDTEPSTAEPDERWLDGLDEAWAELTDEQRQAIELRLGDALEGAVSAHAERLARRAAACGPGTCCSPLPRLQSPFPAPPTRPCN